ncbi:pentapeptide repeat-containing protein [Methanosarcina barkeri]|uniref:pentapeptide repeat-containing protein n=1 Tax=Methanosarcina barkeri TaxID=2208 RepID=UPI0026BDF72C
MWELIVLWQALQELTFPGANLAGTNFTMADLEEADLLGTYCLAIGQLSKVKRLRNAKRTKNSLYN